MRSVGRVLGVARAEGSLAVRDRLLERWASWRRRRRFRPATLDAVPRVGVLNLLGGEPRPDFGGVPLQLLRRLEVERRHRGVALLARDRRGYRLEVETGGEALSVALAAGEPEMSGDRDLALEGLLGRVRAALGSELIHVEGLSGWPLGSLSRLGGDLVLSVHDFTTFCVRPHLLERPHRRFCGYAREPLRCRACLAAEPSRPGVDLGSRRRRAAELLGSAVAVLFPSPFLLRAHRELFPAADASRWIVVPPAVGAGGPAGPLLRTGDRPGVAYVGSVHPHKGAVVFGDLVARGVGIPVRWLALGGGDPELLSSLRRAGVRVRGYYRSSELGRMLRAAGVGCAVLPSIWPEAYNMVLDDCLRAGVPVVAFDLGAPGERLRVAGGVPVPLPEGVDGLAAAIREVLSSGAELRWPETLPTPAGAAGQVLDCYRTLGRGPGLGEG